MNSTIYLPKKIKVGYNHRNDTYTKKLAYIIYIDEKGILRKENSWQKWRDQTIEPSDFDNTPIEGFVLNKQAGGYSSGWNHRQSMIRVYDPRGFEFEITVENLLYILEYTNSIKGKGLEGEFIYGWDGTELVLLPAETPDYQKLKEYSEKVQKQDFVNPKEMKIGVVYQDKSNEEFVYMGKYHEYSWSGEKSKRTKFFFVHREAMYIQTYSTITKRFYVPDNDVVVDGFHDCQEKLETSIYYSPIDYVNIPTEDISIKEFKDIIMDSFETHFTTKCGQILTINQRKNAEEKVVLNGHLRKKDADYYSYSSKRVFFETFEAMYEFTEPRWFMMHQENGRFYMKSTCKERM